MVMTSTNIKKKKSLVSLALGALIVTGLSTGTTQAFSCTIQCSPKYFTAKGMVGQKVFGRGQEKLLADYKKSLNSCAKNCKMMQILDIAVPGYQALDPMYLESLETALRHKKSAKIAEQANIEGQLKEAMQKKNKSKIKSLGKKSSELGEAINKLTTDIDKIAKQVQEVSKAPSRPTSKLPIEEEPREVPSRPTTGPHLDVHQGEDLHDEEMHHDEGATNQPPSHSLPHIPKEPPKDLPPTLEDIHGKGEPLMKKGNAPLAPYKPTAEEQAYLDKLKKDLKDQGKTQAEIIQALKQEREAMRAGKPLSSGKSELTTSEKTNEPSPQEQEEQGSSEKKPGVPPELAGLGDNPMAKLKKVPDSQKSDRSGAILQSGENTVPSGTQGDMFSEMKKKVNQMAENRKSLGSPQQPQQSPVTLTESDKQRLDRRIAIDGEEEIQADIESSLEDARKWNKVTNIKQLSAELDYVKKKIGTE